MRGGACDRMSVVPFHGHWDEKEEEVVGVLHREVEDDRDHDHVRGGESDFYLDCSTKKIVVLFGLCWNGEVCA